MTRLRSVGGDLPADSDYPDSEFVAEVLREHPELIPKHEPNEPRRGTWGKTGPWLLVLILTAAVTLVGFSFWDNPGKPSPADPNKASPSHAARPSKPLRHSNPPSGAAVTGADLAPNRLPRPVPRVARSVSPKPAAPVPRVVPRSGQPPQQTAVATPAPQPTPSPSPTPLLDSIPTPSLPIGPVLQGSPTPTPTPTDSPAPQAAPSTTPPPAMPDWWNPSLPLGWPPPGLTPTDTASDTPSPTDPLPTP